jgi:hypothetical protein
VESENVFRTNFRPFASHKLQPLYAKILQVYFLLREHFLLTPYHAPKESGMLNIVLPRTEGYNKLIQMHDEDKWIK